MGEFSHFFGWNIIDDELLDLILIQFLYDRSREFFPGILSFLSYFSGSGVFFLCFI